MCWRWNPIVQPFVLGFETGRPFTSLQRLQSSQNTGLQLESVEARRMVPEILQELSNYIIAG